MSSHHQTDYRKPVNRAYRNLKPVFISELCTTVSCIYQRLDRRNGLSPTSTTPPTSPRVPVMEPLVPLIDRIAAGISHNQSHILHNVYAEQSAVTYNHIQYVHI